jgi:hypothetical protein
LYVTLMHFNGTPGGRSGSFVLAGPRQLRRDARGTSRPWSPALAPQGLVGITGTAEHFDA